MKLRRSLFAFALCSAAAAAAADGNYVEHHDTIYQSLTIEKRGAIVELRARARGSEALESAVDLTDPLQLVVPYTRSLYAALFIHPQPKRVLMIGLGGAGFHRLFNAAYPGALLHTVELDQKVFELAQSRMGFKPNAQTPVTILDGRMFVKRNREKWDWIILDAFRGGSVPPHLKAREFYQECAERLTERGVFVSNLHATTRLFYSDVKTIAAVFPQVVLFDVKGRGNMIAVAVKYRTPDITDPKNWAGVESLREPVFRDRLDLADIRAELTPLPLAPMRDARVLTDDFAPSEFLDALKINNSDGK